MAFKYRGRTRKVEEVVRRSKQSSGSYDSYTQNGITRFKPKEGENRVRILPPGWEDTKKWGTGWEVMASLHRNVGADQATYLCLAKMKGKPCPVCDARAETNDKEEADELRVQSRPFCYVVDRDNEKAGAQFWDMPMGLFRDINQRSVDKRTNAVILVDDPNEGYDIMFTREGSGKKTKYTGIEVDRDPSPLHENGKKMQRMLDFVTDNPLPSVLQFFDAEHIEKTLFGMAEKKRRRDDDEDEDEDEEENTSRKRGGGSSKKKRRPADEDEDEEDEEEEEEDEDEEDEKPARRKRRRADEDEDEEEEEDEEEDEEDEDEEDEKPARKRGSKKPSKRKPSKDEEDEDEEEEDEEDEDEDEEDEKPSRSRRRPSRSSKDEEDEDEDEDDAAPKKRGAGAQAKKKLAGLKKRSSKK